jgi:hypothetical protein
VFRFFIGLSITLNFNKVKYLFTPFREVARAKATSCLRKAKAEYIGKILWRRKAEAMLRNRASIV